MHLSRDDVDKTQLIFGFIIVRPLEQASWNVEVRLKSNDGFRSLVSQSATRRKKSKRHVCVYGYGGLTSVTVHL